VRPRDSLLEALTYFKALSPGVTVNEIIAFLYTCENEGLSVQELAYICRMTEPTASRSIRTFGPADSPWSRPPALGLVEAFMNPKDGRSRVIHLTEAGREARRKLDAVIRQAIPIGR
jgi:DNA-binding MarR family transcriptional regulator